MDIDAGAVLFTVNLRRVAAFYEGVAGMKVVRKAEDHVDLKTGSFRLTVHQIPDKYAEGVVVTVPPVVRDRGAVKLSFRVDSIRRARELAAELGGAVYDAHREWSYEAATVCDGYDPDGNVFQLFQSASGDTTQRPPSVP